MAAAKKVVEVALDFERDTKGTHIFSTKADGAKVTNVYVKKGTFEGETPSQITLTISA